MNLLFLLFSFGYVSNVSFFESSGYFTSPMKTDFGIVATDDYCSSIYLAGDNKSNNDHIEKVEKIVSSPGCGRYYCLSPDKRFVGFKLISSDGYQVPALYDLKDRKCIRLNDPVKKCGQVSFSDDGKIAYTIDNTLVVIDSSEHETYDLKTYSNIAPLSPDGEKVVFNDDNDQLVIMDLESDNRYCFTDSKFGYAYPHWSANSRFITFSSLAGSIYVYDIMSKTTFEIGPGSNPAWSHDSKYIIYHKTETDGHKLTGSDLFTSKYDGSETIKLTNTPSVHEMDARFFNNDKNIIFHTYEKREIRIVDFRNQRFGNEQVMVKSKNPLPVEFIQVAPRFDFDPRGSRDSINVPYIHQVYDSPEWHNGHASCAPTTALMAIAYYRKLPYWDCWCSTPYGHTSHFGNYICATYHYRDVTYDDTARDWGGNISWGGYGYMWYDGYSPYSRMVNYINYHDLSSWTDNSPTWSETVAEVQAGYPYCICAQLTSAGHLVLAVGQVLDWHTLIFNDPYGNKNQGYMNYYGKYARYDWPGYNNGYANLTTVHWCRGARGTWESACDTIVDDLQFRNAGEQYGFYMYNDPPSTMRYFRDNLTGYNGHMWWTYTAISTDTCYVTWTPQLPFTGNYEVFAYIPSLNSNTIARYQVHYDGGTQVVAVNQANYSNQWVSLGTFPFSTSGNYVYLGDATGTQGQNIGFDAMKWSYRGTGITECETSSGNPLPQKPDIVTDWVEFKIPEQHIDNRLELKIFDISGRNVKNVQFHNKNKVLINTSCLPAGVYLFRLESDRQQVLSGKFIKLD